MISSNCEGSVMRPEVATGKVCCTGVAVGGAPRRPAAYCWFCAATAFCTSVAVRPRLAMRSGLSHRRIA